MRGIFYELSNFSVAMFDDTDVGSFAGNYDNSGNCVVAVFLLFWIVVQF
jgi:hypothetical protein